MEDDWTKETLRDRISSYDISTALSITQSSSPSLAAQEAGPTQTKINEEKQPDKEKIFKKELYHYLRWALSAGAPGPGIPETMMILGPTECKRRITEAIGLSHPYMLREIPHVDAN